MKLVGVVNRKGCSKEWQVPHDVEAAARQQRVEREARVLLVPQPHHGRRGQAQARDHLAAELQHGRPVTARTRLAAHREETFAHAPARRPRAA